MKFLVLLVLATLSLAAPVQSAYMAQEGGDEDHQTDMQAVRAEQTEELDSRTRWDTPLPEVKLDAEGHPRVPDLARNL